MKKAVTIKEIARKLGLSFSTVSRALHDHTSISLATRNRVKQTAAEMGYEPNQTAIFFQKGKTFTIGVILPEVAEYFFSSAISAIEDIAYQNNYTILLAQSHDDEYREIELVEKLKNHRIDGLLVSIAKNTSNFDHFIQLENYGIPVVYFDRVPPLPNIHSVVCNIEGGTIMAVDYLLKRGHQNIGLINGPPSLMASAQRKTGFISTLQNNGIVFNPAFVVDCDLTQESTELAFDLLFQQQTYPSAIVCFNDYVSAFAIKHALKLGVKVNEDIEFVSFANSPISELMEFPPIASIEQFPEVQGQKAIEILMDLIKENSQSFFNIEIESKLVERLSK